MPKKFSHIWNRELSGIPGATLLALRIAYDRLADRLATIVWSGNLRELGNGSVIQRKVIIRQPGNIAIGKNCSIAPYTSLTSEFFDSCLCIGDGVTINRNVHVDYSGGLIIGADALFSENVMIFTHSHGYNPRSIPKKTPLMIGEGVWLGANVIITEGVNHIAPGTIVAAGAVVTREIVKPGIYGGVPASWIKDIVDPSA